MAVSELHRGVADVLHSSAGFLSVTFFLDAAVDVMRMLKTARNTDACKAITAELPGRSLTVWTNILRSTIIMFLTINCKDFGEPLKENNV